MAMESKALQASIRAAKAGRQEGYESLLAAYGPRLYGYFFRMTGHRHDAEDLLGEVMLRLVRKLGTYDERGRFEQWLFRVAANLLRDRLRRRKAAPTVLSLSAEDDNGFGRAGSLAGRAEAVDARLLAAEAGERLMAAMNGLDERTRHMIVLRHFSQMSYAEIAELMDCPLGTVLARVHRGLKALRTRLTPSVGQVGQEAG